MTTNEGAAAAPTGTQTQDGPQLALQAVYLKDCSFEAPNGPRVDGTWNPHINLDLQTAVNQLAPDVREVVLTVTVSAKQSDAPVFLVEVKQAGVFLMRNLSQEELKRSVGSICPNILFPYARAVVSQLVTQGGFPQFLLPPVNFDALYARTGTDGQSAAPNGQAAANN
ncbi:MAG TPA: protein-export chaperone SecB [Steroidobacteraceae bacterium]|nr:protein-export chaperone SecB [Steroidobacteraceae bacterium]